jgi:3-phosphoshikimate 1-carboxyvinyltransferase
MKATIRPGALSGVVWAPRSKSSMQRACAAALLHRGVTCIIGPGDSNDDLAALDVIRKLGAQTDAEDGVIRVTSRGVQPLSKEIHCGESGLGIRMFTPIAALSPEELVVTGSGSLVSRPMHFFDGILPSLGVTVHSNGGRLPLRIRGPLTPSDITVDGSLSSQFLTGLLMAFSAAGAKGVTITVKDLKSKPYIDLTLDVMRQFGMQVPDIDGYDRFRFPIALNVAVKDPVEYRVEGDWSGASFLIVAAAVAGDLGIDGLQADSVQADRAILEALSAAGGRFCFEGERLLVERSDLRAFDFDATECPDLFPPLAALAACCDGVSSIRGVERLVHKESDRGVTIEQEFSKLGVTVIREGDWMRITGGVPIRQAACHSRHDHRIAMSLAVAALRAGGPVSVDCAEAVAKSYPGFFDDLSSLGARVDLQE